MVRAILTERQTGDSYVTCRFEFSFQEKFHAYGTQAGWKTSIHCFVKVLFDALANMFYSATVGARAANKSNFH